jgi:hypothetical protein
MSRVISAGIPISRNFSVLQLIFGFYWPRYNNVLEMVLNRRQASYLTNTLLFAIRSSADETKDSAPRMPFFQIVFITRNAIQFILQHA